MVDSDGTHWMQDDRGVYISEEHARKIASEWHGGQASALYAFSSSGYFNEDTRLEALDLIRLGPNTNLDRGNVCDLAVLIVFLDRSIYRYKSESEEAANV